MLFLSCAACVIVRIHRTTVMELLVDNASVPAGGPFIVLLPAGGPFVCLPLVDNASVTACGAFIFCSGMVYVTAVGDIFCWCCCRRFDLYCCFWN